MTNIPAALTTNVHVNTNTPSRKTLMVLLSSLLVAVTVVVVVVAVVVVVVVVAVALVIVVVVVGYFRMIKSRKMRWEGTWQICTKVPPGLWRCCLCGCFAATPQYTHQNCLNGTVWFVSLLLLTMILRLRIQNSQGQPLEVTGDYNGNSQIVRIPTEVNRAALNKHQPQDVKWRRHLYGQFLYRLQ